MTNTLQNTEIMDALRNGAFEIERLRRDNELLAVKAQAFDTFTQFVAMLAPKPSRGYGIDAAWVLRKLLAELEAEAETLGKASTNGASAEATT